MSANPNLNTLLRAADLPALTGEQSRQLQAHLALLLKWNEKLNLTAIRNEEQIMQRHFVESIACAHAVPSGVASLLDFGSGAGFPGIPVAVCRAEIKVTLAESQRKKAAFLQEVARVLGVQARVFYGRAEALDETFDCVVLRAVEHMEDAAGSASKLVAPNGWLGLMTTTRQAPALKNVPGRAFSWNAEIGLPGSDDRIMLLGQCRPV